MFISKERFSKYSAAAKHLLLDLNELHMQKVYKSPQNYIHNVASLLQCYTALVAGGGIANSVCSSCWIILVIICLNNVILCFVVIT